MPTHVFDHKGLNRPATRVARLTRMAAVALLAGSLVALLPAAESRAEAAAEPFAAEDLDSFAGAFLAARTADYDRDDAAAIDFYRKALSFQPGNAEVKRRLMISLLRAGEFDSAVPLAEQLRQDPAISRVAAIALAVAAIRDGTFAEAEAALSVGDGNDLDRLLTGLLSAWARYGAGQPDEALAMIDALAGPDWYDIFKSFNSAAMAEADGRPAAARRHYLAVLADQPGGGTAPDTYVRAVMALAGLEARAGNRRAALDALATGERFTPGYQPLTALRQAIEAGGSPAPAIASAAEGAAAVMQTIGSALNQSGAEDVVMLYLQLSKALDPTNASTLVALGGVAEDLDKADMAIGIYESVPVGSPMRRLSDLQLGLNLADIGKTEEARARLEALIADDPADMRGYIALGRVLSQAEAYRDMADVFDRAVAALGPLRDRSDWNVFFQRGIAYERLKEWDKAEPNFREALRLYPDQPQVLNYLGYSWIDMNINLEEGMEMIRKAVELRPNDGYIVDSLGWAHYRLGEFDDAVRELERAVELRPEDATINDHLGDAYWRVGRRLEAVYQWNRALAGDLPEEGMAAKIEDKIANGLPPLDGRTPANAEADTAVPGAAQPETTVDDADATDERSQRLDAPAHADGRLIGLAAAHAANSGDMAGRIGSSSR